MRCLALMGVMGCSPALTAQAKTFGPPATIEDLRSYPGAVTAADLDLDGRKDLIAANAFALDVMNGPASIAWMEAGFRFRRSQTLPLTGEPGFHAHSIVQAVDMDRDGREDLILVNDRGGVSVLRNQGPTGMQVASLTPTTKAPLRLKVMDRPAYGLYYLRNQGHEVGDFDNDGNPDLVVAGDVMFLSEIDGFTGLALLPGDGKGGFRSEETLLHQRIVHFVQGRIDSNGIPDLVCLGTDGKIALTRFLGGLRTDVFAWTPPGPANAQLLAMGDLDDDGTDELAIAGRGEAPELEIYDLSERSSWTQRFKVTLPKTLARSGSRILSLSLVDLDGDRRADLAMLLAHENALAQVAVLYGDGKGGFSGLWVQDLPTVLEPRSDVPMHWLLRTLDLDDDLNPELVVGGIKQIETEKMILVVVPNLTTRKLGKVQYGHGTRASSGQTPTITTYGGEPRLGNRDFGIAVGRCPGDGVQAALMMFYKPGGPWQGPGFEVNVFPRWSIGTRTSGTGATGGWVLLPLPVPDDQDLLGMTWHFQWLVEDPADDSLIGIAVSPALSVSFGPR